MEREVTDRNPDAADGEGEDEAVPYLLGDPKRAVPPDDLYGKVNPLKNPAADEIRESTDE